MINTTRHAAEGLFKRPEPAEGSDAAKLQDFRTKQALRQRETKRADMETRLAKRGTGAASSPSLFR